MEVRTCRYCHTTRAITAFRRGGSGRRRWKCRHCDGTQHTWLERQRHRAHPRGTVCETCGTQEGQMDLDHDHATGQTRGTLCHPCNIALGMAKDNPMVLRALADYLERHRE